MAERETSAALWEDAPECGVCSAREWRPVGTVCGRRYAVCTQCGVTRLYDRVAERSLHRLYGAGYYSTVIPSPSEMEQQLTNPTFYHRCARLEACIAARERRLLEVGCGDGNFLAVLRRSGWEVHGLEFSEEAASVARRRHGISVTTGSLADLSLERPFPAVAAYHVLEHEYHPARWMQSVRRVIESDGLLHLQVPNAGSLTRRLTGTAWAGLIFPEHVYFYTPKTLVALLDRFGFTAMTVTTWDPWHGPGTVARSLLNVANRLVTGQLPWTDELGDNGPVARAAGAHSRGRPFPKVVARRVLERSSASLARLEAIVKHGAVVDVVAVRRGGD